MGWVLSPAVLPYKSNYPLSLFVAQISQGVDGCYSVPSQVMRCWGLLVMSSSLSLDQGALEEEGTDDSLLLLAGVGVESCGDAWLDKAISYSRAGLVCLGSIVCVPSPQDNEVHCFYPSLSHIIICQFWAKISSSLWMWFFFFSPLFLFYLIPLLAPFSL